MRQSPSFSHGNLSPSQPHDPGLFGSGSNVKKFRTLTTGPTVVGYRYRRVGQSASLSASFVAKENVSTPPPRRSHVATRSTASTTSSGDSIGPSNRFEIWLRLNFGTADNPNAFRKSAMISMAATTSLNSASTMSLMTTCCAT